MGKRLKKIISLTLGLTLSFSALGTVFAAPVIDNPTEERHYDLAERLSDESVILLENGSNILPLDSDNKVAVFGNAQKASSSYVGILEGLENEGIDYYQPLAEYYAEKANGYGWGVEDGFYGTSSELNDASKWGVPVYSTSSWNKAGGIATPETRIDDELVEAAGNYTDTAIFIVTRNTGVEEMDRAVQAGDWYLNYSEEALLEQLTENFSDIIVVLSLKSPMDFTWLDTYGIDTVLYTSTQGTYTHSSVAKIIAGSLNPSGKLTDTLVTSYEEQPTSSNFRYEKVYADYNMKPELNDSIFGEDGVNDPIAVYEEDIYLGYKFFDTFGLDVRYPFGYGLSYASFSFGDFDLNVTADGDVQVKTTITNTTADTNIAAGKEVMEVYVSKPQVKLEQPYQHLLAFNKTSLLEAGESESLTASFSLYDISSYSEEKAAYVLEPGYYYIRVGNSSRNTDIIGALKVDQEITVEQLSNQLPLSQDAKENVEFFSNEGVTPITYNEESSQKTTAEENALSIDGSYVQLKEYSGEQAEEYINFSADALPENSPIYTLKAVDEGLITAEQYVSQFTAFEMMSMLCGNSGSKTVSMSPYGEAAYDMFRYPDDNAISLMHSSDKQSGSGVIRSIARLGMTSINYIDGAQTILGASNVAIEGEEGLYTMPGWPTATARGCTWNPELLKEFGEAIGEGLVATNSDGWLAPSLNLHRNPLNGRYSEYISEDGRLSGLVASIISQEVEAKGVTVCIKHFVGNEAEHFRRGRRNPQTDLDGTGLDSSNTIATERVMREEYLKAFEIVVKDCGNTMIMSSFNKINGVQAAGSGDLLMNILRGEWLFNGIVVADWGDYDNTSTGSDMLIYGNNITTAGGNTNFSYIHQMHEAYESGELTLEILQRNTYDTVIATLANYSAFDPAKHVEVTGSAGGYNMITIEDAEEVNSWFGDLNIYTTSLPNAIVGLDYSTIRQTPLAASGGMALTYSFALADGSDSLPDGMVLRNDGTLTGTPKETGEYELKFIVTADTGEKAEKTLNLTVESGFTITTESLADGKIGSMYEAYIEASEDDLEYTLVSGNLPDGVTLSPNGKISGFISASGAGVFDFTVEASNGTVKVSKDFTIYVAGPIVATPGHNTAYEGFVGEYFEEQIQFACEYQVGFKAELDETIGDALPNGLSMQFDNTNTILTIKGTPAAGSEGNYRLVFCVDTSEFLGSPQTSYFVYNLVVNTEKGGEETDKSILNKWIEYAEDQKQNADYQYVIKDVKDQFEAALSHAKEIQGKTNATEAEVYNAWTNLMKWVHALGMQEGNKALLLQAITAAGTINLENYVSDGQEEFKAAFALAKEVYAKDFASQAEIDNAVDRLINSMMILRLKADKSILDSLLLSAKKIDSTLYTADSYAVLLSAIAESEAVMNTELSTDEQDLVDAAVLRLQNAIDGLKEITPDDSNSTDGETESESVDPKDTNDTNDTNNTNDTTNTDDTKDTDNSSGKSQNTTGKASTGKTSVKTGDNNPILYLIIISICSICYMSKSILKKNKK